MKKIIILFGTVLLFTFITNAQNDTLYIMKDNSIVEKFNVSTEIDSIVFYNPSTGEFNCTYSNYTDERDGNVYRTVNIGGNVWMVDNLKYLPEVQSNDNYSAKCENSQPAYGVYGYDRDDVNNAKCLVNYHTFGVLYNEYTIVSDDNVCPSGWHVSTDEDWKSLEFTLGMSNDDIELNNTIDRGTDQGAQLAGIQNLWFSGVLKEDENFNTSCFLSIPAGIRVDENGRFDNVGEGGYWWCPSEDGTVLYSRTIQENSIGIGRNSLLTGFGYSVRCVQD